jgi:hypothetical protein
LKRRPYRKEARVVGAMRAVVAAVFVGAAGLTATAISAQTALAQTESASETPLPAAPVPDTTPAPGPSSLPEIGRTRARVLCTALREVVAPAIRTTQHADVQFSDARGFIFGAIAGAASARGMAMRKIDRAVVAMAQDVMKLKALLDDPRLVVDDNLAGTGVEKARSDVRFAIRALYDSESRQLNALNAYVETGRRTELQGDDEDALMTKSALQGITASGGSVGAGNPSYLGGPPRYTNKLAEANEVDRWFARVIKITTQREEAASNVIVAVAVLCR